MKREIHIPEEVVIWFKRYVHPNKENQTFNGEDLPGDKIEALKRYGLINPIGSHWHFQLTEVGEQVYWDW